MGFFKKPNISNIKDKKDIKVLIKNLKYDIPSVRINAIETLGEMGDARAVKYLIKVLKKDKDEEVRCYAADALGMIGDERAVESLIQALRDEDENVQEFAEDALVKIGKPSVEPLIQVLGIGGGEPVLNPFKFNGNDMKVARFVQDYAQEVLVKIGEPAVEPLILVMKDTNKYVRRYAAEAIGQIGDKRGIEPLIDALRDEDENVRTNASWALKTMKWKPEENESQAYYLLANNKWDKLVKLGKPAVKPLIEALNGKHGNVQWDAAEALGKIGDKRCVESLIQALDNEDHVVRKKAAEALELIGDERGIEPLIDLLCDENEDIKMKAAEALDSLGWKPDDETSKVDYLIAKQSWDELVKIGKPAVDPLIEMIGAWDIGIRNGVTIALGKIGDERAIEPLIHALYTFNNGYNIYAEDALVKFGKPAVEPLIFALNDADENIRENALRPLYRITKQNFGEDIDAWVKWSGM